MPMSASGRFVFQPARVQVLALVAPLLAGAIAAALLLSLPFFSRDILAVVFGLTLFMVGLWVSGNPRLLCLWGLIAATPLSLSKKVHIIPHMGGVGGFQVELSDAFLLALVAFVVRDLATGHLRWRFPMPGRWWLALTLLGIVDLVWGPLRMLAAEQMVEMLKELLFFLILVNELVRARQFVQTTTAIAVMIGVLSLVGFAEFVHHGSLGLGQLGEATDVELNYTAQATYMDASDVFRIGSLIGHPNLFAATLSLMLPLMMASLFSSIGIRRRLLIAACMLAGLGALVLTLSRTSWLSFGLSFVALLVFGAMHPRIRRRYVGLRVTMVLLFGASVLAALPQIIKRFTASDPGALNFRYEWMGVAWQFVKEHPVFGIGLNTFVFHLPNATQYGDIEGLNQHFGDAWPVVHNIYLIVWSEQGTVGFVLLVMTYLSLFVVGFRNMRRLIDERLFMLNLGCIAGLLSTAIDGMSSFYLRNTQCARCFWLVAAMMVAIQYWQQANARLGHVSTDGRVAKR